MTDERKTPTNKPATQEPVKPSRPAPTTDHKPANEHVKQDAPVVNDQLPPPTKKGE